MRMLWRTAIAACVLTAASTAAAEERFKLLVEHTSSDMERALNETGAAGYRFAASPGGKSTFPFATLEDSVVVVARDPEGRKFRYIVLGTMRVDTMQRELNEVPPEFEVVGMTAFLGEAAIVLEADDGLLQAANGSRREESAP